MNARKLKSELQKGSWVKAYLKPPLPPEEWSAHKQERMQVAIACTIMHIVGGKELDEIADHFSKKGVMGKVTKQRISQYVSRGIPFLIDRGMFAPAKK